MWLLMTWMMTFVLPGVRTSLGQDTILTVRIANVETHSGVIMIAVFDSPEHFLTDSTFQTKQIAVSRSDTVVATVVGIPNGTYAISVFHDVNHNGELDKNFLGVPIEPIGFSNNVRATFGPPKFSRAAFVYRGGSQMVDITLY
jgi:uncharacterized protein (DUF2141 family)